MRVSGVRRLQERDSGPRSRQLWSEVLAVHVTAPFILARELGRSMIDNRQGKTVILASMLVTWLHSHL
jgi:NAD(P)-dependent dehydrogenase (short-subunit alcohol dehydrogenase family)